MFCKFGKSEPSPSMSLILLHGIQVDKYPRCAIRLRETQVYYANKEVQSANSKGTTHRSIKLVKAEMLEGIGPSRPLPWISLLTTQFANVLDSSRKIMLSIFKFYDKEKALTAS